MPITSREKKDLVAVYALLPPRERDLLKKVIASLVEKMDTAISVHTQLANRITEKAEKGT